MITIKEIKQDLKNIKYYYSMKKSMDETSQTIGHNHIYDVAEKYNKIMRDATPKYYDLYSQLYVKNHTQESLADFLGVTREFINKQNRRLVQFIQKKINEEMEGGE